LALDSQLGKLHLLAFCLRIRLQTPLHAPLSIRSFVMRTWFLFLVVLWASQAMGYGVVVLDSKTLHLRPTHLSSCQIQVGLTSRHLGASIFQDVATFPGGGDEGEAPRQRIQSDGAQNLGSSGPNCAPEDRRIHG